MNRWTSLLAFVAMLLAGCGSSTPQCTPGESAQCFCADGTGAQTCGDDGTYGACDCGVNSATNVTPNNMSTMNNAVANNVAPNNVAPNNVTANNVAPNNMTTAPTNNMTMTPTNNMTTPTNNMTTGGTRFCKQTCGVGPDCAVFGDPSVWDCNGGTCDLKACTTDDGCVKQMSNWAPGCNSDAQCGFGFSCVTIDAANYCAFTPIPGFFECGELQLDPVTATSVESGMDVMVCGAPDALCEPSSGNCFRPCAADAECRPAGRTIGLICIPETGQCGCTEDSHCTISGNRCVDGECACSGQAVCDTITAMAGVPFVCAE